jgi:photosystem II stability/assembly factor-like uncharacterized protein
MENWKSLMLAFLLSGLALGMQAQNGWYEQNAGTSNWLNAVHFTDSLTGWTVGDNYTIRKTTDGGQTWFSQSFGQAGDWSDIFFVDANIGWLTGKQGQIYKTIDGGSNWGIQHLSVAWKSIHFSDAQHGWAVGYNGWIVATTDGGTNWNSQTSGTTNYLNQVFFIDNNRGWAVGNGTTIIRTTNGGTNWTSVTDSDLYCDLNAVDFSDSDSGFVAGDCSIFSTQNGGGSNGWTDKWPSGYQGDIHAIWFLNGKQGWIAGTLGKIWATEDGGENWTQQSSPFTSTIEDMTFSDAKHGWVVGYGGVILHTQTGGITAAESIVTNNTGARIYPNPFVGQATLKLDLENAQIVEITVMNSVGSYVSSPARLHMNAGQNLWNWGKDLPNGLYQICIKTENGGILRRAALKVVK